LPFPYKMRKRIGKKRGWRCEVCGRKFSEGFLLEFHHITFTSWGGKDTEDNCLIVCLDCHLKLHLDAVELDPRQFASVNLIKARLKKTNGRTDRYNKGPPR